jgi:hypothetical protein
MGEIVYEEQDEAQKGAPVVPGILVHPEPFHPAKPKIPVSSRMHHRKLNIWALHRHASEFTFCSSTLNIVLV